jgi:hypothetical protein
MSPNNHELSWEERQTHYLYHKITNDIKDYAKHKDPNIYPVLAFVEKYRVQETKDTIISTFEKAGWAVSVQEYEFSTRLRFKFDVKRETAGDSLTSDSSSPKAAGGDRAPLIHRIFGKIWSEWEKWTFT